MPRHGRRPLDRTASRLRLASFRAGVLVAGTLTAAAGHAAEMHATLAVVSDYVVHGLSRSLGEPAAQMQLSVSSDRGFALGAWASSAHFHSGPGVSQEYAVFAAKRVRLNADFALDVELSRYEYPGDVEILSYDYTELRTALSWRDALELAVAASPDSSAFTIRGPSRERTVLRTELAVHHPLGPRWSLAGGVGYADLSDLIATGYWYFSAAAELRWHRLTASLGVVAADSEASYLFRDTAGTRYVGAIVWQLR